MSKKIFLYAFVTILALTVITGCSDKEKPVSTNKTAVNTDNKSTEKENAEEKQKRSKDLKDVLLLANKKHALPADYEPVDLVAPNVRFPFTEDIPKRYLRKEAAEALEELFKASDAAGLELFAQSGYRSYARQKSVFAANVASMGEAEANAVSARPGESEHQTGLVMDVTSAEVNFDVTEAFGDTKEGQWLKDHAHESGFIIRYLKGKEAITEYSYEPWHIRYVGKEVAKEIYEKQITLEEYLGVIK